MNKLLAYDPNWYRAFTLIERLTTLPTQSNTLFNMPIDRTHVEPKLQQWSTQEPFAQKTYFKQRLANEGLDENALCYLLNESIATMQARLAPPTWFADITDAFTAPYPSVSLPEPPDNTFLQQAHGFLNLTAPLVNRAAHRLRKGITQLLQTFPDSPFEQKTAEAIFLARLPRQLLSILHRTLILELHVARLEGKLKGSTPTARYQEFTSRLLEPDVALALFEEYPVLARQVVTTLNNWVTFSLEFLNHLCEDWPTICVLLTPDCQPGMLTKVNSDAGDRHRHGRSVLIAEFNSGFRLVYKPRALGVEKAFQHLLTWLNNHSDLAFQTIKIIDQDSYGWVEYIETRPCTTSDALTRFYERQGGYLALLYALEATDFHYENLIASGEHPVLVDLESLFHPRIIDRLQRQRLGDAVADSVLRTGLLPQRFWVNDESDGLDIGGLSATAGQLTPTPVLQWGKTGTDEMHITRDRIPISGSSNRPSLNGQNISVVDYIDAISRGFAQVYEILLTHRDALLVKDGPLDPFLQTRVRVILRPTRTYAVLLQESFHPDLLRDALDRDRFLDKLWVGIDEHADGFLPKTIPYEHQDLLNGDIPLFTTRPDSCHLWSSSGTCIPDFFMESAWTSVEKRLKQLEKADLERQLWFIHASLSTVASARERPEPRGYIPPPVSPPIDPQQLLAAAKKIGDRLEELAFLGEKEVHWIGLAPVSLNHNAIVSAGSDLYSGLPGIILFLARLGQISGEPRYTRLAEAGFDSLQRQLENSRSTLKSIGAYHGWGGIIYTFMHLSNIWQNPSLLQRAVDIVPLLPSLIVEDNTFDIIGGSAGCIIALANLHYFSPSVETANALQLCGKRLQETALPQTHGIGWPPKKVAGEEPLTGLSHGAAGIAWALFTLADLTGDESFNALAEDAIFYERSLYSPEAQNWPDLRKKKTQAGKAVPPTKFTVAWCHGAPGIGLARLLALPYLNDDKEAKTEIETALQATFRQGFGGGHCLCHGDLGNLELFLQAKTKMGDTRWDEYIAYHIDAVLHSFDTHGWLCGNPLYVEEPGLMTGLAGIGYQLLRLAEPNRVPSVLTLEPPCPAGSRAIA